MDGLKHVFSSCQENISLVVLQFEMGVDVSVAADDVREKLDAVLPDLPETADRPIIEKVDINAVPVASMFLTGDIPVDELYDYADNTLDDRFSTVRGVEKIELTGGNEREVWVELDRDKVVAAGLTSWDIVTALRNSIVNVPGGRIREAGSEYNVRFTRNMTRLRRLRRWRLPRAIADAAPSGSRFRAGRAGRVQERAFLDGRQGVAMRVVKKSEGNTVTVVKESRKRYEEVIKPCRRAWS